MPVQAKSVMLFVIPGVRDERAVATDRKSGGRRFRFPEDARTDMEHAAH